MIYFDNAATTFPKPPEVYDHLIDLYKRIGVNASRGSSIAAEEFKELENILKSNLAKFAGLSNTDSVILNSSATMSINQILQGLDYSIIQNVYISPFEHNAVYRTIEYLRSVYKFNLNILPFDRFDWNKEKTKLFFDSKRPDLLILNHASNVFGNILPVKKIFSLSKEYNSINVLDAAQTFGLLKTDMNELNIDYLVFAGHKTLYGPSGIGGFIINNHGIKIKPVFFGGTGINSEEIEMPYELPEKFEIGSTNSLGILGLYLSVKWNLDTGIDNIYKKKKLVFEHLVNVLCEFNENIEIIYGEDNVGVLSCMSKGLSPSEFGAILSYNNIAIRTGLHCSPLAHKHLGTAPEGTVRFSVSYFNTEEETIKLENICKEVFC